MNEPTGYSAIGVIGFTDRGQYSSNSTYVKNDIVHYQGNLWRCLIDDTTGVIPNEGLVWTLFVGEPSNLVEAIIAPMEVSPTENAHAIGDEIIYNDTLYDVIAPIGIGDTLTVGTNINPSPKVIQQIKRLSELSYQTDATVSTTINDTDYVPMHEEANNIITKKKTLWSTIISKIKFSLATVATSGSYTDLSDKPSINNATLTIQKNGSNVQTFTANASSNATANIIVPTKVSELSNDSGYTTNTGTVTQVKVGSTAYNPSSGVVSLPAYPTVNNATLTIQKNGSNVQTFTANASSNVTANITVPTQSSDLSDYKTILKVLGLANGHKLYMESYFTNVGVIPANTYSSKSISFGEAFPANGTMWGLCSVNYNSSYWGNVVCSLTGITRTGFSLNYGNTGAGATGGQVILAWVVFCYV